MNVENTKSITTTDRSGLRIWLQAIRPFSFTASMVPVFFATALAVYDRTEIYWTLLPLVVLASLAVHAATNLVSEYYDYRKHVDRPDTFGGSRVLVDGLLSPKAVMLGGLLLFALTGTLGLVFIYLRGWPIFLIGAIGMAGGFFYTALPIGFKYRGLGDLFVFWLMGPLMVIGAYFVLTGAYQHSVLLTSLPIGCLVAAILSGNNLRDIPADAQAGIKTTAGLLGHTWARFEYMSLVLGGFFIVCLLVVLEVLPVWTVAVLLTMPLAIRNIRAVMKSNPAKPEQIMTLDVQTAQLHLAFGIVLMVGVLIGAVIG